MLWVVEPGLWPVAAATLLLRGAAAWTTADLVLHDSLTSRLWLLIPLQDIAGNLLPG